MEPTLRQPPTSETRDTTVSYHPLVILLASAVLGATCDRLWQWSWTWELTLAVLAGAWWIRNRSRPESLWGLLLLTAMTTAFSHHVAWRAADRHDLHARLAPQPVSGVIDVIVTAPLVQGNVSQRQETCEADFGAVATWLRDGDHWRRARGALQVTITLPSSKASTYIGDRNTNFQPAWAPGDRVRLYGELRTHPPAMNPGDWDPMLSRRTRRESLMRVASPRGVVLLRPAGSWSIRRRLWQLRDGIERRLRRYIAVEQADLAVALLLGKRHSLDFQQRQMFKHSGTAHLLALSGLHVGLLASVVWTMGRVGWLGRRGTCLLAGATAVAYLVVAGPRPSLVRATVLIVALAWGRWLGRPRAAWNSLALAALIMVICDPSQVFDTGAQLSFLAVAALCRWGRVPARRLSPLEQLILSSRSFARRCATAAARAAWQWLVLSALVWMVTSPVAAWRFGLLAPIGILLNPIAGPMVAVALYAALLVVGMDWWPRVAATAGATSTAMLEAMQSLAQWGAAVPGGHFHVAPPPAPWAVVGCGLWCGWAAAQRKSSRWSLTVATTVWLMWGAACQWPAPNRGLSVTVLAVGHGSCIVIRTPQRKVWVYDAGRLGGGSLVSRALLNCLEVQRDRAIDGLIVSHEDADHYNAVVRIIASVPTRQIVVGPRMLSAADGAVSSSAGVRQLAEALRAASIPVRRTHEGASFSLDDHVSCEVLHPPSKWRGGCADNADSLVLRLRYRGRSILLTGDVEGPGLVRLLARPTRADVLLAPHHGSPNSHPAEVLNWSHARWVVVSSGHFRRELEHLDAHVFQTARDGAVTIRIDNAGVTVEGFRPRQRVPTTEERRERNADCLFAPLAPEPFVSGSLHGRLCRGRPSVGSRGPAIGK